MRTFSLMNRENIPNYTENFNCGAFRGCNQTHEYNKSAEACIGNMRNVHLKLRYHCRPVSYFTTQ
jgi:hypothetical protein